MTEKVWRSASKRTMYARPIPKKQFPKLVKAMQDDGLIAVIGERGIEWSVGGYDLTAISVGQAWNLTPSQMTRLAHHIYEKGYVYKDNLEE